MNERPTRLRIYHIDYENAVMLLNWAKRAPQYIAVPEISGLPDGAEIESMFHCDDRRTIAVIVSHPSFPEVEPGFMIPHEDGAVNMRVFSVPIKLTG